MKEELEALGIIPDVLHSFHPPSSKPLLHVTYHEHAVHLGNVLTPTIVKDPPHVTWHSEDNTFYTLLLTDPDAPSRQNPKFREWHHWLIVNIKGSDLHSGQTLSQYIGSGPPPKTGLHRYVFILFKQKDKLHPDEPHLTNRSGQHRGLFSTRKFMEKHHLVPIDVKCFQAEWDDYVPILYKQLEG